MTPVDPIAADRHDEADEASDGLSYDRACETEKLQMLANFSKNSAQLLALSYIYRWNVPSCSPAPFSTRKTASKSFVQLVDEQMSDLFSFLQAVASRMRQLGAQVEAPFVALPGEHEPDDPARLAGVGAAAAAEELSHKHLRLASFAEELNELCAQLGDDATALLLRERRQMHEACAWRLLCFVK